MSMHNCIMVQESQTHHVTNRRCLSLSTEMSFQVIIGAVTVSNNTVATFVRE